MANEFKHIRTSILPCGFENGFYKFSLCIDLNPNYDNEDLYKNSRLPLSNFIKNFALGDSSIFRNLVATIPTLDFFPISEVNHYALYPRELCHEIAIISQVPRLWREFIGNNPEINQYSGNLPPYTAALNISAATSTTVFGGINDRLPDPTKIRQKTIAMHESFDKNVGSNFNASYLSATNSLSDEMDKMQSFINRFAGNLDGISAFAATQNKMQSLQSALLTGKKLHANVFDSVDALLEIWSFIDSNNLLQRLMGKTIDFKVSKAAFEQYTDGATFELKFGGTVTASSLNWEHLATPVRIYKSLDLIVITDHPESLVKETVLEHTNYDIGGKMIGLKAIANQYKDYEAILRNPSVSELKKYEIRKKLIALDTASLTIGVNTYNKVLHKILQREIDIEASLLAQYYEGPVTDQNGNVVKNNTPLNYLYRIVRGYRFAVNDGGSGALMPLGKRKNNLSFKGIPYRLPADLAYEEFAISASSGSHALLNGTYQVIQDEAVLNWSGLNIGMPSPFSNPEDETNFEVDVDEGSTSDATRVVSDKVRTFYEEDYALKGVEYVNRKKVKVDAKPVKIEYSLDGIDNKKLLFGNDYGMTLTPEYKNGWAIPTEKLSTLNKQNFTEDYETHIIKTTPFTFKRNEPIKPVEFLLTEPLNDKNGKPAPKRDGETLDHLVIRNFSVDNINNSTSQQCIRFILPPEISFQQAFWYNKIFEMSPKESYRWYWKYNFPKNDGQIKRDSAYNAIGSATYDKDNPADLDEIIAGSTLARDYYPDFGDEAPATVRSSIINYLPDPLCKGFRLMFYLDKNRTIKAEEYLKYEDLEFYFTGTYPKINAWKLIVLEYGEKDGEPYVTTSNEKIFINVNKGKELFISARTLLHENYEAQLETYGNYNEYTQRGNNDLLTPPLDFDIVHAVQRPLVTPKFHNLLESERTFGKTDYSFTVTSNLEQTGTYKDNKGIVRYIEENIPTGSVEVYAKWEEYQDLPDHIFTGSKTPNDPVNQVDLKRFKHLKGETPAVYEGSAVLPAQLDAMERTLNKVGNLKNEFKNYTVDLKITGDARESRYIEKYFWIKNRSKFTAYYPVEWGTKDEEAATRPEESEEYFNMISQEPFMVRIFNCKKPEIPELAEKNMTLVAVNEQYAKGKTIFRKSSMNRLRFFFKRGRLTSGKGERIGFVLNEPKSKYNNQFIGNGLVSIVGRDVVADSVKPFDGLYRNSDVLLTKANFVINDPYDLSFENNSKGKDIESFYPQYVEELGIMTYLPKFDAHLNLWYLDVEVDINDNKGKQLHSPFLRFSMVHYQEFSHDYNSGNEADITKDCRISVVSKSGFVYILPSRNIRLEYSSKFIDGYKYGVLKSKITFDKTSLKGDPQNSSSKFYAVIRKKSGAIWKIAGKVEKDDASAFYQLDSHQSVKEMQFVYIIDAEYQVVIIETEDWGNVTDDSFDRLIENRKSRIVHVNTFEINNNGLWEKN